MISKGPPIILLSSEIIQCLKRIDDINKQDKVIKLFVEKGKLDINTIHIE